MMGGGVGLGKDIAAGMSNLVGETARGFFLYFPLQNPNYPVETYPLPLHRSFTNVVNSEMIPLNAH